MGRVSPVRPRLGLTVVVEGVEKHRGLELSVQLGRGHGRCHPLMIGEQSQEGFPTHVAVVPVSPVCVHELDCFPQDIFTLQETKPMLACGPAIIITIILKNIFHVSMVF